MLQDPTYPVDTMVRLGQLIDDPRRPDERVGREPLEFGPDDKVHKLSSETNFTFIQAANRVWDIDIGATIMSFLPFGIRGHYSATSGKLFEIERIDSQSLDPSDDYVERSLRKPSVREYLAAYRYQKPLYMIVGIKVGRNARIIQGRFSKVRGKVSVDVPGYLGGIPVDPKVELGVGTSRLHGVKRDVLESFVFAYRLREVRYSVKLHLSRLGRIWTKGARLHSAEASDNMLNAGEIEENDVEEEIECDGLSGRDVSEESVPCGNMIDGCILLGSQSHSPLFEDDASELEFEEVERRVILF